MTELTPEVLAGLRRLHKAGTTYYGMWDAVPPSEDGSVYIVADEDHEATVACILSGSPHNQDIADGNLIVAAVNALPALLDAAEREAAARMRAEERAEPCSVDDVETRAFIAGWNARVDHDEFDMALHFWMLSGITHVGSIALSPTEQEKG